MALSDPEALLKVLPVFWRRFGLGSEQTSAPRSFSSVPFISLYRFPWRGLSFFRRSICLRPCFCFFMTMTSTTITIINTPPTETETISTVLDVPETNTCNSLFIILHWRICILRQMRLHSFNVPNYNPQGKLYRVYSTSIESIDSIQYWPGPMFTNI